MSPKFKVEILDKNFNALTEVINFAPLSSNSKTVFLEFDTKLSDIGDCRFRISTKDPMFDPVSGLGDIVVPYQNHVRVSRYGTVVWQGVVIDNKARTKDFIEVNAKTYLFLLNKVLIVHDPADGNGAENYRTLKSGTMSSSVQQFLTETIQNALPGSVQSKLTVGTIENPNFPAGFVDSTNAGLTGTWTWSTNFQVKFDYRSIYYVLNLLGIYGIMDFELTTGLQFNFKKFIGSQNSGLVFEYGQYGAISDYNVPRNGQLQVNKLTGIAADNNFQILKKDQTDTTSIGLYGQLEGVAAYSDVKTGSLLGQRLAEEIIYSAYPDDTITVSLNDRAYPIGQYGIGDIVNIKIIDHSINVNQQRRIIGIKVNVSTTGQEQVDLITNKPRNYAA